MPHLPIRPLLCLLPLVLAAAPAGAHPHVWIDASLQPQFQDGRITAFDITWRFDEFYSELVQQDFDTDGDGSLSQTELDALVGISATNLIDFSFFTHLKVGGEERKVLAVTEFYAEVEDGLVVYRFRVPLADTPDPRQTPVAIGLFDDSYYVEITLPKSDIHLDAASGCQARPAEDKDQPLYYGTYFPTYIHLECGGV